MTNHLATHMSYALSPAAIRRLHATLSLMLLTGLASTAWAQSSATKTVVSPNCDSLAVVELGYSAVRSAIGSRADGYKPYTAALGNAGRWAVFGDQRFNSGGPVAFISAENCAVLDVKFVK